MKKIKPTIFKLQQQRFSIALLASIAAHVLLAVFIVVADHDKPLPKKDTPHIMDVVLLDDVKKPIKKANKNARTISNQNAAGSSLSAKDRLTRKAKAPLPAKTKPLKPKPKPKQPAKPVIAKPQPKVTPAKPKETRPRLIAKSSPQPVYKSPIKTQKPVQKKKAAEKPRQHVPLASLMPSAMALSQLSQDFERERRMKQKLRREADIPINTRQVKYAPYAQGLVRALESQWRPNKHIRYEEYSDKQRQSLVKLTIEHDGSLVGIEILRPSPIMEINKSAIKAIKAAAPFKILPSSWGLDRVSFYLTFEVVENGFVFRSM